MFLIISLVFVLFSSSSNSFNFKWESSCFFLSLVQTGLFRKKKTQCHQSLSESDADVCYWSFLINWTPGCADGRWCWEINMKFTIISCRISTYTHYLQHRHVWACTGTCTQGRAYTSAYFEINMCVWVASSISLSSSTYSRPTGLRSKSKELLNVIS